jgi:PAS domain S-box-containing protein
MLKLTQAAENFIIIIDDAIRDLFYRLDKFENPDAFYQWFRDKFSSTNSGISIAFFIDEKVLYLVNEDRLLNINYQSIQENLKKGNLPGTEIKQFFPVKAKIIPVKNNDKIIGFLYIKDFEEMAGPPGNEILTQKFDFFVQQISYFFNKQDNEGPAGKFSQQYIESLESKVKTLTGLNNFSLLISSIIYNMDKETLAKVVSFCGQIFEASHCALIMLSEPRKEAEIVAGWQKDHREVSWVGLKYAVDSPLGIILNETLYNKSVVSLSDVLIDYNLVNSLGEFSEIFDLKTTILFPLFRLDNFFGFLVFRNDKIKKLQSTVSRKNDSGKAGETSDSLILQRFEELGVTLAHILSGALLNAKLYNNNIEIKFYLTNLIKSSRDAIISLDLSGKIILWNQGAQDIFGFNEEEILGKNFYYLFSSESRIKVTGEWIEILTGRVIMGEEGIGLRKDGEKISISYTLSPINDKSNEIIGVSIIFRDLTERKKLEQDISESKNRLQAIFDSLSDQIVLFDLQHKILMANKMAINFTGLAPRELIGQNRYKLIDNIFIDGITPIELTVKTKKSYLADEYIFENRVFNIKTFPVFDSLGNLTSVILHARDLTREKSLYNQVMESERMAIIGELTTGITHELNNPLSIILSYAENLKANLKKDSQEYNHSDVIITNTNRISSIIEILNKFTYNTQINEPKTLVDLNNIIKENLNLIERLYTVRGIKINFNSVTEKLTTYGYQNQLQQVILSIMANSFNPLNSNKKSNFKGEIDITTNKVIYQDENFSEIRFSCSGYPLPAKTNNKFTKHIALTTAVIKEHGGNINFEKKGNNLQLISIHLPFAEKEPI